MGKKPIYDTKLNKPYDAKKIKRQLTIFELLKKCHVLEFEELALEGIDCCKETFKRDIKELKDAGLNVRYEKIDTKYRGYVWGNSETEEIGEPVLNGTIPYIKHIEKLNRLCRIILNPLEPELEPEPDYDDLGEDEEWVYVKPKGYKSPFVEWYKENFPNCSKTTMRRDFEVLNEQGYKVVFDKHYKIYIVDFSRFDCL